MNKFKKYCPNVWVAECEEKYEKGDIINIETKYGKEVPCEVFNLVAKSSEKFFYSVVRIEEKTYAQRKAEYWENKAQEITLAMPESIEYFSKKLEKAIAHHKGLKDGTIKREHSYSLTYANKEIKKLKKKVEIAKLLWGEHKSQN